MKNQNHANLRRLSSELEEAKADHALIERLRGARERMERLAKEYEAERERIERERIAAAAAAKAERLSGISNVSVADTSTGTSTGLIHASYRIAFTKRAYDFQTQTNRPQERVIHGFRALPPEVIEYLTEVEPQKLPSAIRDLAPGNPRAALNEYFAILQRGYAIRQAAR